MSEEKKEAPPKKWTLKKASKEYIIEDEAGKDQTYTLRELSGTQRDNYLNLARPKQKIVGKGKDASGEIVNFKGICSDLLCMCLYGPDGNLMDQAAIDDWPAALQMHLYTEAMTLSGLNKEGADDAKNG